MLKASATIKQIPENYDYQGSPAGILVSVTWEDTDGHLDRIEGTAYGLGEKHMALAKRTVKAINAQRVFYDAKVVRDIYGKSYVQASTRLLGRTLNADLKRLGF